MLANFENITGHSVYFVRTVSYARQMFMNHLMLLPTNTTESVHYEPVMYKSTGCVFTTPHFLRNLQ
jgi:hypothetical protein